MLQKPDASKTVSSERIPVGISACLAGEKVRYDGAHKRSDYCNLVLAQYFDFRPFCPEMAIGLGTPRPIIRLTGQPDALRAIQHTSPEQDITEQLADYADTVTTKNPTLCGYIFTEKSPSCGLFRVRSYKDTGEQINSSSRGIFAKRLTEKWPLLPVEEAGRLNDADLCENFVLRVYTWHEWHTQVSTSLTPQKLLQFWSRYKFLTLAHDEKIYRKIGPLLAKLNACDLEKIATDFFTLLMTALATISTRASNTNALQHLRGFIKNSLHDTEKSALNILIEQYHSGIVPLIVPLAMLRHLLNRYPDSYAGSQRYLQPYPDELGLRNKK